MNHKHKRPRTRKDSVAKNAPGNVKKRRTLSKARVKQITRRISGPEAAYDKLLSEELCLDLTGKLARKSAKQTGDDIGSVRFNYERIVTEFISVPSTRGNEERPLSEVLRKDYETDDALEECLSRLAVWIRRYMFACIDGEEQDHRWKLRRHIASPDLMTALAKEYVRDRKALMLFLSAAFKRWRQIYAPDSPWRVRLVTQQIAQDFGYNRKAILKHLQEIGAVPNIVTSRQLNSWLSKIGQYLSRDQRTAAGKDFGFRRGPALKKKSQ